MKAVWLTVNRNCNFRCLWCYAEGTTYAQESNMTWETGRKLVGISMELGIRDFILLGGEPTYWPQLNKMCDYLTKHEANATVVTNGWRYANLKQARIVRDTGAKVSLSVKAGNPDQYYQLTKVNAYGKVIRAINNFAKLDSPVSVSITASALVTRPSAQ
jgi:molybdenum cofactor biosynthesis enzyme MoaA